jgi:hypothetical protein
MRTSIPRTLDSKVLGTEPRLAKPSEIGMLDGEDVTVIQTKASRLGMYLMGQALFSRFLVEERFGANSVCSVALYRADDDVLRPLAERAGIEVVVDPT